MLLQFHEIFIYICLHFFYLFTVDTEGYEFSQNVPKFYTGGTERFWGPNLNPGTLYILFF